LARGSSQQVWIKDIVLMKNLSQTLLLVGHKEYRDYKYDDLGGFIELLDEIYK
jgi:hypothetical protein